MTGQELLNKLQEMTEDQLSATAVILSGTHRRRTHCCLILRR
jgi:hypothetical protein